MEPLAATTLPKLPKPASYAGCIYSRSHEAIFIIGSKSTRECYKYNISSQSYSKLTDYPPSIRPPTTHTVLSLDKYNDKLISLGGSSNHYAIFNTNDSNNNNSETWDLSLNSLTNLSCSCSIGVSAVKVGDYIHIINGCSGDASDAQFSYQILDLKNKQFVKQDKLPKPPNRIYLKGLIYIESKNSLLIFGGMEPGICTSSDLMYTRKLNNENLLENKWELMKTKLPMAISAPGYCKININININNYYSWLIIIGGGLMIKRESKEYYNTIFVYDIINDKFSKLNETIINKLAGISCVYDSLNGNLHIIGGGKGNELTDQHIMHNIGMNGNNNPKNINPIKYRELVWKTLILVSAGYIAQTFMVPLGIWHLIFDMIDDGLLLPLLVEKPYKA